MGLSLFQSLIASSVALEPDLKARFLVSSNLAESMLLDRSSSKERDVTGVEADTTSQTTSFLSLAYGKLCDPRHRQAELGLVGGEAGTCFQ